MWRLLTCVRQIIYNISQIRLEMRNSLIILFLFISFTISGATYYVSPGGSDSNPGTISQPFFTLNKAWTVISAGDIVYMRGGTYVYPTPTSLTNKSGSAGNLIKIWAYPGEKPVIDYDSFTPTTQIMGITLSSINYVHIKGIRISNIHQPTSGTIAQYGIMLWNAVNNCLFEMMEIDHIGGWGVTIGENSSNNTFLNCDSHHNADPYSNNGEPYGWSDGFESQSVSSTNNTLDGCRAWWNSDDGFDLRRSNGNWTIKNCWSFWNGYIPGTFTQAGNGEGYKLGGKQSPPSTNILRRVTNCLAFENRTTGFSPDPDYPEENLGVEMYNCTSYNNKLVGINFQYSNVGIVRNNIVYNNSTNYYSWGTNVTHNHNNLDIPITVSDADFVSVSSIGTDGPRQADGSLPNISFLKLATGSKLIDAGVDVGIPYGGNAPDLGVFEMQTGETNPIPVLISAIVENETPSLLEITYDLTLNNLFIPANSSFNVQINSATRNVNSVAIVGAKVRLTLANAIVYGDIVRVTYNKPSINPLQTTSGGMAGSYSNQSVTNNCASVIVIPVYISSVIENSTPAILEMTYNLSLANKVPATSAFNVQVNSVARTVNSVAIIGSKVRLTLTSAIVFGDIVTVAYAKPSINPLQTASGGMAASISNQKVINNCLDPNKSNIPPVLVIKNEPTSYSGFIGQIDASGSYNVKNAILSYEWTVPNNVSISSNTASRIKFLSPVVNTSQTIEFQLKVTDGTTTVLKSIPITAVPYKPELDLARIISIEASNNKAPDFPNNISDGNLATKWSATGDNQWLLLKLAEPFKISHLEIAFLLGQKYSSYFDIYASKDKLIWEPILINTASCNFSGNIQVFDFPALKMNTGYSYIKFVGHGNSLNWVNNIAEFKIFGIRQQNPSTIDNDNRNIIIYPNPAADFFNISVEEPSLDPVILRLIDFSGRIVFEDKFGQGIKNIQIPSYIRSGIYIVELISKNLTLFSQKLVVKR